MTPAAADLPVFSTRDSCFEENWSISEAIAVLGLTQTPRQLRARVKAAGIPAAGRRHSSSLRGTLALVYPAEALILLAAGLSADESPRR